MCWMKNLPRRFSLCVVGLSAVENWLNCCPIVTGFYSWSAAPKKGRSRTGGCRRAPENWGRKGEGWRNYLFFYYYVYRRLLLASLSLFLSLILFSYLFIFSFVWWWCPSHLWVHSLSPVYNQPQKPARLCGKLESRSVGERSADWATRQVLSKMMDGLHGCFCCWNSCAGKKKG